MHLEFNVPEYQRDGSFEDAHYEFQGDQSKGWQIRRNGATKLELPSGYIALESLQCGVCSTDLARRFLPYDLPQVIGHEVVALRAGQPVTVEINASHFSRGATQEIHDCPFCSAGLHTQCPDRITLGINKLPGGFSPYLLAPVNACVPIPAGIPHDVAVFTEPFAAALHAVESSPPVTGDKVAVVGPRRLGALIVAALAGFRKQSGINFSITAVARHDELLEISRKLGADQGLDTRLDKAVADAHSRFDLVFDTTGTLPGFELALNITRRTLHLKSTNGLQTMGLNHLTDLVVDELALLSATPAALDFAWPDKKANSTTPTTNVPNVFVAPGVPRQVIADLQQSGKPANFVHSTITQATDDIQKGVGSTYLAGSILPRFDAAIVSCTAEADSVIRPIPEQEFSIVRPRGALLLCDGSTPDKSALFRAIIDRNIELRSSRCGDFRRALDTLAANEDIGKIFCEHLVTHHVPLKRIADAFAIAADSKISIKVVVDTANEAGQLPVIS